MLQNIIIENTRTITSHVEFTEFPLNNYNDNDNEYFI